MVWLGDHLTKLRLLVTQLAEASVLPGCNVTGGLNAFPLNCLPSPEDVKVEH
jgi:hypothetical protein